MKKYIPLIVGTSIPILMIIFVAGSIYLPGIFIKPKFNFLYVSKNNSYDNRQFFVSNGKLIKKDIECPEYYKGNCESQKIFLYDVYRDESKQISFEDAQKLKLNSSIKSPDGFEIVCGRRSEGFFIFFSFGQNDCSKRYIQGHNINRELNLQLASGNYYNFQFIGWIED